MTTTHVDEEFTEAKRKFAWCISEMIARLAESEGAYDLCLFEISFEAAPLAATLGFPKPPVEHMTMARGERDPLLLANSDFTHIHRAVVHDPGGLTSRLIRVGALKEASAPAKPVSPEVLAGEPKLTDRAGIANVLRRWERDVAGREVQDIRYSKRHLERAMRSFEQWAFNRQLEREIAQIVDPEAFARVEEKRRRLIAQIDFEALVPIGEQMQRDFCKTHVPVSLIEEQPTREPRRSKSTSHVTRKEAEKRARALLEADPDFRNKSLREWAELIECSEGLVAELPSWKAVMEETGRGRRARTANPAKRPEAVNLSDKTLARAGDDNDPSKIAETDEILQNLIDAAPAEKKEHLLNLTPKQRRDLANAVSDQRRDAEPSPLAPDPADGPPGCVRTRKQL